MKLDFLLVLSFFVVDSLRVEMHGYNLLKEQEENKKDFEGEDFEFNNFEIQYDEVKVETDSENSEIEYEIQCKEGDPIISKMKYNSKNITSGVETETKSRVLIHGIQEWFDKNNDGIIQDDEKIGSLYYIGEFGYNQITYVGPDIYDIYDFTIREKTGGYLTMVSHLTSNFTEYYTPNSMKFDIIIENWQYENSENQLALLMEYRTENEMETDEIEYISQKTTDPSLGYSALQWINTFTYDDTYTGSIQTRILNYDELSLLIYTNDEYEGEQSSGIWFCFTSKGANTISWDPDIGVYTTPISNTGSSSKNSELSNGAIGGIVVASIIGIALIGFLSVFILNKIKSQKEKKELKSDGMI